MMRRLLLCIAAILMLIRVTAVSAQTTAFTYQGKLTDSGAPANGSYQMQFKLFDAVSGGAQIGSTIADLPATATDGIFGVTLDFGSNALSGANRWLEIAVRHNSGESYTTLSPREQIASSPYSVRTLSAAMADDSQKLGGVNASEYVTNSSVGSSFIRNDTAQQTANFNINGSGFIGTNLGVGTTTPTARLNVVGGGFPNNVRITDTNTTATALDLANSSSGGHPWRLQSVGGGVPGRVGNLEIWEASTAINPAIAIQPNGSIGINTMSPSNTLDVNGFFRASHVAGGNVVTETPSGTNSWAKFWVKTPVQQWSIGSSTNFNGNQLYFSNESGGGIQMAIMPNGNVGIGTVGPVSKLHLVGNATQDRTSGGWIKAMVYVGNGIIRCYNSTLAGAAATAPPCGFVIVSNPAQGQGNVYVVNFGFKVDDRFWAATSSGLGVSANVSACTFACTGTDDQELEVTNVDYSGAYAIAPFMLLVY